MNWLAASFPVGRIFDINVRVHILFLIWIGFELLTETMTRGGDPLRQLVFLGMLFGIVLLHEFGHCFGARSVGGDAENILMWPLGGLAYAHAPMRPWPQFVTVAAGPAVNVVFCLISGAILAVRTGTFEIFTWNPMIGVLYRFDVQWVDWLATFYCVNYFLLAFNLLPVYPLDGGQIFHAVIWPFVGLRRATLIAAQVGLVGCVILGLLSLQAGGGMLLFIALFGGVTCWQRYQAAREGWLVEDTAYTVYNPRRGGGFWSRLFKLKPRRPTRHATPVNPNAGAWEARQKDREQEEAELDRLLKKVSEHGINSLSYVERQKLERITRERQKREREFQRHNTL